jgi:uncharacterized OB-fold protein
VPDDQSAEFWRAASEHVLAVARCSRCERLSHPPDVICPHCGSTDPEFAFAPMSGRATVMSWTVVRRSFLPGFDDDLPYLLVDVELADAPDVRMIGMLLDGPDAVLRVGAPVRVAFEDVAEGVAIPAFRLEARVESGQA